MDHLSHDFNVLNGKPNYLTIEETSSRNFSDLEIKKVITYYREMAEFWKVEMIQFILKQSSAHFIRFKNQLNLNGFTTHSTSVIVWKNLQEIEKVDISCTFKPLGTISEDEFKALWKESMAGSLNQSSSLSIDQLFESLKSELGESYAKSCLAVYEDDKGIGVVMPHIEPGTKDEGRLFYFGFIPSERQKGKGARIHLKALSILKHDFGARYYVGSTNESNSAMQRVFAENQCKVVDKMVSFRLNLKNLTPL